MLKKQFLLSMLKTVVLFSIFGETVIHVFQDSLVNKKLTLNNIIYLFETEIFWNIHVSVTFDQFNASLLKSSNNFFPKQILQTSNIWTLICIK